MRGREFQEYWFIHFSGFIGVQQLHPLNAGPVCGCCFIDNLFPTIPSTVSSYFHLRVKFLKWMRFQITPLLWLSSSICFHWMLNLCISISSDGRQSMADACGSLQFWSQVHSLVSRAFLSECQKEGAVILSSHWSGEQQREDKNHESLPHLHLPRNSYLVPSIFVLNIMQLGLG